MSKKATERIMPHSTESEQSVLGCVLIDVNAGINILGDLKEEDFYVEAHRIIFDAMFDVYRHNMPVDFVTVTDELERRNMLDSVGGVEYVTMLTNFVPSASNYAFYVEIVKRNSILRKLISASNKITEFIYNNPTKEEALTFAEKNIFDISQTEDKSTLTHIKAAMEEVLSKFETIEKDRDSLKGITTGIYELDKFTNGLQKSDLILVAARPGFGKTSLAMNIVNNAAILGGAKAAIFSLEMPKVQLAQRSLCSVAYVSMSRALKGDLSSEEWKALWAANEKLTRAGIYVDDSSLNTPVEILSKCRRLKAEHGLDLIMIDYLQLMNAGGKAKDNRQQEISEISRSLKILAKELNVPVIVLSQLSRAVETRTGHKPVLSDLRESGAIEQDADIVLFIHRPDMYNDSEEADKLSGGATVGVMAEIIIAKHRNGALGSVPVKWISEYTTFTDTSKSANARSLEASEPRRSNNASANKQVKSAEVEPEIVPEPERDLPEITPLDESDIADIF